MAANISPIFVLTPKEWFASTGTSANTALDGTGTVTTVLTAGSNGSRITRLRITHLGTNVATVIRIFANNGSSNATPANNALLYEYAPGANTLSQVAASVAADIPFDLALQSGYKLNITLGTAVAAGLMLHFEGGDY